MGKWGDCLKNNALKLSIHSRSRHFRSLELISEVPRSFPSLQAHFRGCVTPVGKISAPWNVLEQIPCWAWGRNSFLALKWKFLAGLGVEIPSRTITTVGLHQTSHLKCSILIGCSWIQLAHIKGTPKPSRAQLYFESRHVNICVFIFE